MKRFLFSVMGGYGHLHPLVPLARALQQRGHEIAFAVGASLQPLVEKAGFTVLPVGGNFQTDSEYQECKRQLAEIPSDLEHELFFYPWLFGGISTRLRMPQMMELVRVWQPDMLIREGGEYSAALAAEHAGLPHATVCFATSLKGMQVFEQDLPARLDPIRQAWGLAHDPDLTALYRYLYLNYSPPEFSLQDIYAPATVPPTVHFIRPQVFDQADQASLPAWFADLPAQPNVYLTMGTEVNGDPEFYPSVLQTIITGLRDAPINLIVTLGRGKDPADFGPQPANVHIEPYIPQSLLLPHCDLMIMHGGSNSLVAALDLGLPLIIVPLIADQFFNGEITQRLGLGQVVSKEQLTPISIRQAMDTVLADPAYRQTAQRLQAAMHALPDQAYAVELVERIATERTPILNPALPSIK